MKQIKIIHIVIHAKLCVIQMVCYSRSFRFVRYWRNIFVGKIEKIDQEKLLSFKKDEGKKKTKKRKPSNNSPIVTPFRLSKVVDLNTLYVAFRRACFLPNENKYVPDSDIVFCSNAFKPGKFRNRCFIHVNLFSFFSIQVSSSVKKCQYDYSPNLLQITELFPLRIKLSNETDTCTIRLSCLVSN